MFILTTFDLDEYVYDALPLAPAASCAKTPSRAVRDRNPCHRCGVALLAPSATRRRVEDFATTPPRTTPTGRGQQPVCTRAGEVAAARPGAVERPHRGRPRHQRYQRQIACPSRVDKPQIADRVQIVVFAYGSGLVRPGHTANPPRSAPVPRPTCAQAIRRKHGSR